MAKYPICRYYGAASCDMKCKVRMSSCTFGCKSPHDDPHDVANSAVSKCYLGSSHGSNRQ